jgi:molecular chaperone DnaK
MNRSDFEQRLLDRLRASGRPVAALGIDLGTTKTCVAVAAYDPRSCRLRCECLPFEQPDGSTRAAVPSAVAVDGARTLFGADALAKRGQRGFPAESKLFYETKNDIGLRYTYARAPDGFQTATEIATHFLSYLHDAITDAAAASAKSPLVVTVPASFHGSQRLATVQAAEAGFGLTKKKQTVRLLDEPYAAFLDLTLRAPASATPLLREDSKLMVFDFGGGTCDVAIFRVDTMRGGPLGARLLGTSRYHRLGGGDLDRAIVHDVLIPALLAENKLERWDVSWHEKRKQLEPVLLGVAERLKVRLSQQLASEGPDPAMRVSAPTQTLDVEIGGVARRLTLTQPTLTLAVFNLLLKSFLDPQPPPEAGDEYVQRSSIFSPIVQALFRAGLEPDDVDGVLLCGSSSLLPQVQQALAQHFPKSKQVLLGEAEDLEGAVARGAALQALALQVLGEPLIAPVCSSEVSLRVVTGALPLTRAGHAVPAQSSTPALLRPPRTSRDAPVDIAVEVVSEGERLVGRALWQLPAPVSTDDRLALSWRMDENQCIELSLERVDDTDASPFVKRFDAPITHRDMNQVVRCRMLERCEAIRLGNVPRADLGTAFHQIASDCGTLGDYEKGLHFVSLALQEKGDDVFLYNLRGMFREKIGNRDGAVKSYEQASDWPGARFNLALLHYNAGNYNQALVAVDSAIEDEPSRAYRCLRGDILSKLGRTEQARAEWQDAVAGQPDFGAMRDFDLGWLERASSQLDLAAIRDRIRSERRRLSQKSVQTSRQGELPEFVSQAHADPAGMV